MKRTQYIILLLLICFSSKYLQGQSREISLDTNLSLIYKIEKFDSSVHKIDTCYSGLGWKGICLIDNEPVYGTDYDMPMNEFKELSLVFNKSKISLESQFMYNGEIKGYLRKDQFKFVKGELEYFLYAFFSDGAGIYGVCWQIINGKAFRIVITKDKWFFPMFEHLK